MISAVYGDTKQINIDLIKNINLLYPQSKIYFTLMGSEPETFSKLAPSDIIKTNIDDQNYFSLSLCLKYLFLSLSRENKDEPILLSNIDYSFSYLQNLPMIKNINLNNTFLISDILIDKENYKFKFSSARIMRSIVTRVKNIQKTKCFEYHSEKIILSTINNLETAYNLLLEKSEEVTNENLIKKMINMNLNMEIMQIPGLHINPKKLSYIRFIDSEKAKTSAVLDLLKPKVVNVLIPGMEIIKENIDFKKDTTSQIISKIHSKRYEKGKLKMNICFGQKLDGRKYYGGTSHFWKTFFTIINKSNKFSITISGDFPIHKSEIPEFDNIVYLDYYISERHSLLDLTKEAISKADIVIGIKSEVIQRYHMISKKLITWGPSIKDICPDNNNFVKIEDPRYLLLPIDIYTEIKKMMKYGEYKDVETELIRR